MSLSDEELNAAREKIKQVFQYLLAVQERQHPPVRDYRSYEYKFHFDTLPQDHECVEFNTDQFVLRLRRPKRTPAPKLPKELALWIVGRADKSDAEPTIHTALNDEDGVILEYFVDEPERVQLWERWLTDWHAWATLDRPDQKVENVYQELYTQHSVLERDGERFELVVGDGFVKWKTPSGEVDHPLLLQSVDVHFDAGKVQFTIVQTDRPAEVYTSHISFDYTASKLSKIRDQVGQHDDIGPMGDDTTTSYLKGVAPDLDVNGIFADRQPTSSETYPVIYRRLVLFRRNRNAGLRNAIKQILEDVTVSSDGLISERWLKSPPEALLRVIGVQKTSEVEGESDNSWSVSPGGAPEDDVDTYFTKPGNREQYQIVKNLERAGCVLVQGPPGTGKTHTIANLVGHLLAQGKSVLVTSHTTKALSVVTDKVVGPLQPLCVSVLGSDSDNRAQLERTVHHIEERMAEDPRTLSAQANELKAERLRIINRVRELRERVRQAQRAESVPISYLGEQIMPMEAAKELARRSATDGWIPGSISNIETPPLSVSEIEQLYVSNLTISKEEEDNYPDDVPDLSLVPDPDSFSERVLQVANLRLQNWSPPSEIAIRNFTADIAAVKTAMDLATNAVEFFAGDTSTWRRRLADAAYRGQLETWVRLTEEARVLKSTVSEIEDDLLRFDPQWAPDTDFRTASDHCKAIVSHLESGKSLSSLALIPRPAWKKTIQQLRISGAAPYLELHFRLGRQAIEVKEKREQFVRVWNGRIVDVGGPVIPTNIGRPENHISSVVDDMSECLSWHKQSFKALEKAVELTGISMSRATASARTGNAGDNRFDLVIAAIETVLLPGLERLANYIRLNEATNALDMQTEAVKTLAINHPKLPLIRQLSQCAVARDTEGYRQTLEHLRAVFQKAEPILRRRQLLQRLAECAPDWSTAIANRTSLHGDGTPPGQIGPAWRWRYLNNMLAERHKISAQSLMTDLVEHRNKLQKATTVLVEALSWAALLQRMQHESQTRSALSKYVQTINRIGKGTGKRVPTLLAEARSCMEQCRAAVPVWVMPLSRIVDSFDVGKTTFDVVIVDESSQLDLNGLIALYMAKQVVIVGDDRQVEPLAVGQKIEDRQRLIDEYLQGIPHKDLWDGKMSVYGLADGSFHPVRLKEHFRSVSDIIAFSNATFYNNKIQPLREDTDVLTRPFVVPHYVGNAQIVGGINKLEADTIIALMVACTEQPEYAGLTVGVINLVGDDTSPQSEYVRSAALKRLRESDLQIRKFRCGSAAQFQGDERDVMFLSVVDTPQNGPLPRRSADLYDKRFNVAASRAADQMWVLYSLDPDQDLKADDLRFKLIKHALDPKALTTSITAAGTESPFEEEVFQKLYAAQFTDLIPQHPVGAYRLDFAIRQGGLRIAIECDGDQFHTEEQLENDLSRQTTLERLGWKFIRLRGSEFYRDKQAAINRIISNLEANGVRRTAVQAKKEPECAREGLTDRVKKRAAELLAQWRLDDVDGSGPTDDGEQPLQKSQDSPRPDPPEYTEQIGGYSETSQTHGARKENASSTSAATAKSNTLPPYEIYSIFGAPKPQDVTHRQMISILEDIVRVEGPMTVRLLLDRYRTSAGLGKLLGTTREKLVEALRFALTSKRILNLETDTKDELGNVVGLPGKPGVWLRQRGPRDLSDIPITEIAGLIQLLDLCGEDSESVLQQILSAYELIRKTDPARNRVKRAQVVAEAK